MPHDAPVPLCERHIALAADWAESTYGVTDTLPSPCRLCGSRLGIRYPSGWLCATCEWRHGELTAAERRLERWRTAFARDAGAPAGPVIDAIRGALSDGLRTPDALQFVDTWAASDGSEPDAPGEVALAVDALLGVI